MRISVIVPFYRDFKALELVLGGLRRQTVRDFEVVVAEDDTHPDTPAFLARFDDLDITHVFHEDRGNRKTVIQNRAVCAATGDYLVFIDGDVIPYRRFLEGHLCLAAPKRVLSGRRVNLDEATSRRLREGTLGAETIERFYPLYALKFMRDRSVRYEQGFQFRCGGLWQKLFLSRPKRAEIIGCNFSCHKADFAALNGFDEDYPLSRLGDDIDLTWRFEKAGYELRSVKKLANVLHLYHPKIPPHSAEEEKALFARKKAAGDPVCEHGLSRYCSSA